MPRLICGLDCLGGGLDELGYVAGVGDYRHVARWDLDGGDTHALASSVDAARGCCTAYMTRACTVSTSAAKWLTKSSPAAGGQMQSPAVSGQLAGQAGQQAAGADPLCRTS